MKHRLSVDHWRFSIKRNDETKSHLFHKLTTFIQLVIILHSIINCISWAMAIIRFWSKKMCTYKWGKFYNWKNPRRENHDFCKSVKAKKNRRNPHLSIFKRKIKVKKMFVKGMKNKWREEILWQNSKCSTNLSLSEKVW